MDGWRAEVSRAVGRLPSGFGSAFQVSHHLALTRLAQTRLGTWSFEFRCMFALPIIICGL